MAGLPGWLEVALEELQTGVAEVPGPASNPRIDTYLAGVGQHSGDETPWCAAFADWCLTQDGWLTPKRPNARSYLNWGKLVEPTVGAITVLWRGSPGGWQGHVAFYLDQSDASYYLLGGNQGDRVSVRSYPKDRLLGFRWPDS